MGCFLLIFPQKYVKMLLKHVSSLPLCLSLLVNLWGTPLKPIMNQSTLKYNSLATQGPISVTCAIGSPDTCGRGLKPPRRLSGEGSIKCEKICKTNPILCLFELKMTIANKNEPNQTQFKPNSNPISGMQMSEQTQTKPISDFFLRTSYEKNCIF